MYPSLAAAQADCDVSEAEARLLLSAESQIVLIARRPGPGVVAPGVAPANPSLGIMLPYTPLHHLLMRELGFPVVATSGNLSNEPICIDEHEALDRLGRLVHAFLVHNRPILRHADDSIVRVILGRELVMRRARGYAPLPIALPRPADGLLAVGAHLKNTIALGVGANAFVSQHIGDLETMTHQKSMVLMKFKKVKLSTSQKVHLTQHSFAYAIALCRADGDVAKWGISDPVWVYDNEPRNREILSRISRVIEMGQKVVIWPSTIKEKDINDMILSGLNVQDVIESNTYSGLEAKLKFTTGRKYE